MIRGTDVAEPVEKPNRDNRDHDVDNGSGTAPAALWYLGFCLHRLLLGESIQAMSVSEQRHYREGEKWSQEKNPRTR
jgi:hypothetical protein